MNTLRARDRIFAHRDDPILGAGRTSRMARLPSFGSDLHHSATMRASDVQDIRSAAHGDQAGLAALYDRHAGVMLALGLRILRVRREAEDVLHDVFLEVWQRAGDFDPARGSVRSWLLLRMRSRSLDRARSHGFARSVGMEQEPVQATGWEVDVRLDARRAQGLLVSLPRHQREVLELGYYQGLSTSEIARQLGVPIGTVKSRLAAALRQLRARLPPHEESL